MYGTARYYMYHIVQYYIVQMTIVYLFDVKQKQDVNTSDTVYYN